ncbi:hypothetical protein OG864_51740 [Streptomyces sp. NBC_00124]|uniref:hypothetical protein n=1 Tax=Streptomyces sp. NBC_00124 TaxID=2975662 RepID=UPI00225236DB|nr:hypothetical protein [Streptomyces sp. NBC_00124]MCX5367154.1 hypothetical protein [Streptomyces sp. NBC_00124]
MAGEDLERWGVQIARWVAPDEAVLAAQITRAYAAGGKGRRELLRTGGLAPGGFGGGIATLLPDLLDALAYAADAVKAALGSQQFANAVSAAALLVSLRAQRTGQERRPPAGPVGTDAADGQAQGGGTGATYVRTDEENADSRTPGAPPQPSGEAVLAALRMCGRLRARGVDAATAEELVAQLTAQLLASEDRGGVAAFLDALVANEPPEPAVHTSRRSLTPVRRLTGALFGLLRRRTMPGADPMPGRPPTTPEETGGA